MSARKFLLPVLPVFALVATLAVYWLITSVDEESLPIVADDNETVQDSVTGNEETVPTALAQAFVESYTFDTTHSTGTHIPFDTTVVAAPSHDVPTGRSVSISICGVDSRMGENVEHADANHVVTLWLDSGIIDIISIPRDTPCDAGYTSGNFNILANVRARRGREAYLREVATIAGVDTIQYYVDVGFSQARALLELLGFRDNSSDALRILRSRHAFASGDFQRCFNQGQFIRQTILNRFDDLSGWTGNLLVRAGLLLVNTNLTADVVDSLHSELASRGFPSGTAVRVCIKPAYYAKMVVYNFSDSTTLGALLNRINDKAGKNGVRQGTADSTMLQFRRQLATLLTKAAADSFRHPARVISRLRRPFEQRVWWQIADRVDRENVRSSFGTLLADAYRRLGKPDKASDVERLVRFENGLLSGK